MECLLCSSTKNTMEHGGMVICRDCYDNNFKKCDCCGGVKPIHNFFMHNSKLLKYILSQGKYGILCRDCSTTLEEEVKKSGLSECRSCGSLHEYVSKKKDGICKTCEDNLKGCYRCGGWHSRHSIYSMENSLYVCSKCYQACKGEYLSCQKCGVFHVIDDKRLYKNTTFLCNECSTSAFICDYCGNIHSNKNVNTKGEDVICSTCLRYTCNSCGRTPIRPSRSSDDDNIYCSTCMASNGKASKQDWNYTPHKLHFHSGSLKGRSSSLYLGFENEQILPGVTSRDSRRDLALVLRHYKEEDIYAVFDSSIGGSGDSHGADGYEIVSHPRTLSSHANMNWGNLFTGSQKVHQTCGMHVHLSRAGLTRAHLLKLMKLVYENSKFIDLIAEREPNEYTQSISKELMVEDAELMFKSKSRTNRRVKVNLCNIHTIELRFFANVVTQEALMKNLEFSHALYYYTKKSKLSNINVGSFLSWVAEDTSNIYTNLTAFLSDKAKEFSECV